ncbi:MAG: exonuclease domain-containing protein [Actinomycetota bacterium]|nr:exonuclease domain-containing protein [Actinomycetota bacterium]
MNAPIGFAVVDTETTGLFPGYRHRIVEVAMIHLDLDGTVTDEWSTLLNPNRDLGPQAIHGIRAADIRRAPRFEQIVGDAVFPTISDGVLRNGGSHAARPPPARIPTDRQTH